MMHITTLNRTDLFEAWAYCTCRKTVTLSDSWQDAECLHCGRRWYIPGLTDEILISDTVFDIAQNDEL